MTDSSLFCSDQSPASILFQDDGFFPWEPSGTSNPYRTAFLACHIVALLTFAVSHATGNLSQVDKLWSILPTMYGWMCVVDSRTALMAGLSTLWSVRLTYNFYRRGGYTWPPWRGDEDYRWEVLRRGKLGGWWAMLTKKWAMVLFNILFISLYQNYLLVYIASPSLVAWTMAMKGVNCPISGEGDKALGAPPPLNVVDGIACVLFVISLIVETVADNQQYRFQQQKREWRSELRGDGGAFANAVKNITSQTTHLQYADGFCQSGLFAIVRKPAYAGEQSLWISYYIFSVAASYPGHSNPVQLWNWSGGGFLLLCLLFQGSGWLTEQISLSKYPKYAFYQQRVPLYVPSIASVRNFVLGIDKGDEKDE